MSGRLPVCEDAAAITARIAELRAERMRLIAGCVCGTLGPAQHDVAGNLVHAPQCPLRQAPQSAMEATLEAMARARARLRQAGVPIRERELPIDRAIASMDRAIAAAEACVDHIERADEIIAEGVAAKYARHRVLS